MVHISGIFETLSFHATRSEVAWTLITCDCDTGEEITFSLNDNAMGAVLALACSGGEYKVDLTDLLYDILPVRDIPLVP